VSELFQWLVGLIKDARFWQIVLPWERAVRCRFGKWTKLLEPGFHWRIPYFDEMRVANTRQRVASTSSQTVMTVDQRTVTVAANIAFRIVDPLGVMMRLQQPENICAAFAQGEFARFIAAHRLDELHPGDMEAHVVVGLQEFVGQGIAIDFVRVIEFCAVKTLRLLQEQWKPSTGHGDTL
jgi:hypothetical protein